MIDLSVIYYTSNRELPGLERLVKENITKVCGGLPIISVSQKPIDFGQNICVGDHGISGFNMFRQVQVACQTAKTRYVVSCEADCLYPPDYFTFIPPRDDRCYRDTNLYVMGQWRKYFYYKEEGASHAQVINRELYLNRLDELFKGAPDWSTTADWNFPRERWHQLDVFDRRHSKLYRTENPVVQIKSDRSMRHYTHSDRTPIYTIPYWGNGADFRKKYYANS